MRERDMGGYAGDTYRPGTKREQLIGGIVMAAFFVAFLFFLAYSLWMKS
jgi:hypothetical protein